MASRSDGPLSLSDYEGQRRRFAADMYPHILRFMVLDNEINESVVEMARTVSKLLTTNPDLLGAHGPRRQTDASDIGQGIVGSSDIAGGDWESTWNAVKDVITFIKEIGGSEKEFIKDIIRFLLDMDE